VTNAQRINIAGADGFRFSALSWRPDAVPRGGVIVVQEIFGLSSHIAEMGERFRAKGFAVLAPSMFDRLAPGFVVEPDNIRDQLSAGRDLAVRNGDDNALGDIAACRDALASAGKVFITGYCYGGSMSWLAAQRLGGLAAASCYYGGRVPQLAG